MAAKHLYPFLSILLGGSCVYACSQTPPPSQPQGDIIPLSDSDAAAPTVEAKPAASEAPAASASAAPEKKPRPAAGAPMAVSENDQEVTTTYGLNGGIIRIGGTAELRIPRGALTEGMNFYLGLNSPKSPLKIVAYKGQLGDVYRIAAGPLSSPVGSGPGLTSSGEPFLLKLPLPKGKTTANLAVIALSDSAKPKYTVIGPKSVEESSSGSVAVFELPSLVASGAVHLTSAPPTGG